MNHRAARPELGAHRATDMDVRSLPALWGRVTAETLAALTGAHVTTARRWKKLQTLPRWLATLVAVTVEGELAPVSREFAGWIIRHGELVSPEGERFTPGQIRAAQWHRQRAQHLARRLAADQAHQDDTEAHQAHEQQRRA